MLNLKQLKHSNLLMKLELIIELLKMMFMIYQPQHPLHCNTDLQVRVQIGKLNWNKTV